MASYYDKSKPGHVVLMNVTLGYVIHPAGSPGMTACNSQSAERDTLHNAVLLNGTEGVRRTRGVIPAHISVERRHHSAVQPEDRHTDVAWNKQ